jgi:cysteine synthase
MYTSYPSTHVSCRLKNSEAHERWTGPQLEQQIPDLNVFAAALGTSGEIFTSINSGFG